MKCNHEIEHLVGTADGILCKKCNRIFVNFAEIEKDRDTSKSENLGPNPDFDGDSDKDIEKVKTEAVPAEDRPAKAAKTTGKKAVSKTKKS